MFHLFSEAAEIKAGSFLHPSSQMLFLTRESYQDKFKSLWLCPVKVTFNL